jgi:hypothetical protein
MTIQISSLKRLVFNLYLCVFVCSHACGCMQKPLEGVGSSGARVLGSCELLMCVLRSKLRSLARAASTLNWPVFHFSAGSIAVLSTVEEFYCHSYFSIFKNNFFEKFIYFVLKDPSGETPTQVPRWCAPKESRETETVLMQTHEAV